MLSQGVTVTICLCAMLSMVGSGVGWTATAALSLLIGVGMWALNKMYYFTHNASIAFAGIFMMLQCAMPAGVGISALLFVFAILVCTAILFSVFNHKEYTRSMYLIFLILGAGAIFDRCYLWAVPVFLIGIAMMRAFSMRGLVASLLGVLTVPLLVVGFDLVPLDQLREPYTFISVDEMLDAFRHIGGMEMVASLTLASALCLLPGGVAFLTAYGYPARTRSYCMFFYLMAGASLLIAVVDFSDSAVPGTVLLNMCAAFHTSHFATSRSHTGWVIPLVILISLALNIF
jgi:hypothetical protein